MAPERPSAGDTPGPHPLPPDDLGLRQLPLVQDRGPWVRIYPAHREPIFFGKLQRHRFDDPAGVYGVLYLARNPDGAFIETFGWSRRGFHWVAESELKKRLLARVLFRRPLNLVDLTGPGLNTVGADARLTTGSHPIARQWSAALYEHPSNPDGILYRCRHDPEQIAGAVYDRAASAAHAQPLGDWSDPGLRDLLYEILERYDYGLVDDTD